MLSGGLSFRIAGSVPAARERGINCDRIRAAVRIRVKNIVRAATPGNFPLTSRLLNSFKHERATCFTDSTADRLLGLAHVFLECQRGKMKTIESNPAFAALIAFASECA
jgi:hypothetical protein